MPQYQLKMSRSHETQTVPLRAFSPNEEPIHVSLRQSVVVSFDHEGDGFALPAEELVSLAEPMVAPDAELPAEGWRPWQACMLRETYAFAEPAPLCLLPDSPAGKLLNQSLTEYPSLYGNDPFAAYRVLEHWFCTIGNGLEWTEDGLLSDGLTDAQRQRQREALQRDKRPEPSAKEYAERRLSMWDLQHEIGVPVKLYPLSPDYSRLFTLPVEVEDSFLVAAYQLVSYLLSRPVWENHGYSARDLLTARDSDRSADLYAGDRWRHALLADGAKYRTIVSQGHARLVLGPWGRRLKTLGFEDRSFHPLDYRLPPNAKSFRRG